VIVAQDTPLKEISSPELLLIKKKVLIPKNHALDLWLILESNQLLFANANRSGEYETISNYECLFYSCPVITGLQTPPKMLHQLSMLSYQNLLWRILFQNALFPFYMKCDLEAITNRKKPNPLTPFRYRQNLHWRDIAVYINRKNETFVFEAQGIRTHPIPASEIGLGKRRYNNVSSGRISPLFGILLILAEYQQVPEPGGSITRLKDRINRLRGVFCSLFPNIRATKPIGDYDRKAKCYKAKFQCVEANE
jgi:hypothetical protein